MSQGIFELCNDIVDERVTLLPTLATTVGIGGHDDRWDDFSPEGADAVVSLLRDHRRRLADATVADDPWQRLAAEVAADNLDRALAFYEADEHLLDLNSIASPAQEFRDIFDQMDTSTAEGWGNVAARLERLPDAVDQYIATLSEARARRHTVARRQVVEVARQMRNHAGEDSHFSSYPDALEASGVGDDALRRRVTDGVATARGAFAQLAGYLEDDYLPDAVSHDGVGAARYQRSVARFLGSSIDPVETYQWGWDEVERIRLRMADVAEEILPGGGLAAVLELLMSDPTRSAPSQEAFRQLMFDRQRTALAELDGTHFDVPAEIREIDVRMTPPGGSLGAYYYQPSEDFTRPGTVYWSKGTQQRIPLFDEVSTAYHEGFPGHHLQVGLQMTAGDRFSRLHRLLVWYSGSGEGWALYAEDLMEELGYLEKPDYVMGKMAAEMLRACRVVIDIGCHLSLEIPTGQPFHPGESWTFEAGVEMLTDYAAQSPSVSVSEMNRYLGWPGQAIAYKVGQQAIRDLRSEERTRLGPAYDQKAFHARLLEVGAVGLDLLRQHVRVERASDDHRDSV